MRSQIWFKRTMCSWIRHCYSRFYFKNTNIWVCSWY